MSGSRTPGNQETHHVKVLSWNIDGLDERAIEERAEGVVEFIQRHSPDVVLLQEVVDENLCVLEQLCSETHHFTVHEIVEYYNAIMVKKDESIENSSVSVVDFENSGMGRFLLIQKLLVKEVPFTFMTTHLESLGKSWQRRQVQLQQCFHEMELRKFSSNVIFSGDLNIREKELLALGGPPSNIKDSWVVLGCEKEKEFTWDMQLNDNKEFEGYNKPKLRFDRMFFCPKVKGKSRFESSTKVHDDLSCESFELVGKQKLSSCGLFPSDHFGILAQFAFKK